MIKLLFEFQVIFKNYYLSFKLFLKIIKRVNKSNALSLV